MSSLITENTKSAKYIKKPMAFGESFLHRYKKNGKPMALRPVYCKFHRFCSYAYFGKYLCIERRKCIQMVVSYLWRSLLSVVCSSSICKMGALQRERCQKPQRVQEE